MKLPIPDMNAPKPSRPLVPNVSPIVNCGGGTNSTKKNRSDIPLQPGSMGPPPPPRGSVAEKQPQQIREPDWSQAQDTTDRIEADQDGPMSRSQRQNQFQLQHQQSTPDDSQPQQLQPNLASHAQRDSSGQRTERGHANQQRGASGQQAPFRPARPGTSRGAPDKPKRKKDRGGRPLERPIDRPRIPLSKPDADNAVIVLDDDDDPPPMKMEIKGEQTMEQTMDAITSIDDVMENPEENVPRRPFSRNSTRSGGTPAQLARIRTRSGSSHANIGVAAPFNASRGHSVAVRPPETEVQPESTEDIMNRTVSDLIARNGKLEKQLSEVTFALKTQKNTTEAAEAKVRELTSSLQNQQKKMVDMQSRQATFRKFVTGLGEDFTALDHRNLELKHRLNESQSEKVRIQQDLEAMRAILREACDEGGKSKLTSRIQDLRSEVRRLSDNAKYADATINEKSSLLAEERNRSQLLESQILEERKASRKIAEKFDEMKLLLVEQLTEMKNALVNKVQDGDSLKVET
jgi:hypothetical protein